MTSRLRAVLKGQKGAITRIFTKFEALERESNNFDELQTIEETLRTKLETITSIHEKIVDSIPEENAEEIEEEILEQEDYVFELRNKIQKVSKFRKVSFTNLNANSQAFQNVILGDQDTENIRTPQSGSTSVHQSLSSVYHRLPKLDLPKFEGDILEWQSFWDSYECAIHNNASLSSVQKFTYLRSSLRNEALQTVAGFSLTSANYERAVSLLQERYGKKDKIIQSYMTALLEVPAPVYTIASLRKFYDTTETYIRALDSLDQSESTYGSLLTPVILQKLPSNIRQNMTRAHGSQTWCLPELLSCFLSEINILDAGSPFEKLQDVTATTAAFLTKSEYHTGNRHSERSRHNIHKKGSSIPVKMCAYCNGHHLSVECRKVTDSKQRLDIVKKKQLCFNCLGDHKVSECKSRFRCKKCTRRHHTSLCNGSSSTPAGNTPTLTGPIPTPTGSAPSAIEKSAKEQHNANNTDSAVLHSAHHPVATGSVLLKTAVSNVKSNSASVTANILFDEGSQSSFITEDMSRKLQLKPTGTEILSLSGFGDKERRLRHLETAVIYLESTTEEIPIKVLIVPEISVPLRPNRHQVKELSYLKGLKLAHPVTKSDEFNIEVLVGADYYWTVVQDEVIRGNGPTAIQSKLGYLLSGPLNTQKVPDTVRDTVPIPVSMMNVITMHTKEEVDLEKFWKVESMGVEPVTKKQEYDEYLTRYQENCITYTDGKYVAKLPWKEEHETLPTNEMISRRRTESVINRLKKEPTLLHTYGEIIREQQQRGFIEEIPDNEIHTTRKTHYIPHHPVKKDSLTTPIRIVYDCSCKSSRDSASLNDCLMNTPPHLIDLTTILLRFRYNKYAICTDIEKAFLNIGLHNDDRDVTRFYWLSDPSDPASPLKPYRFKSVLFGATSSPFILHATTQKHLEKHPGEVTELIKRGLYVDNILTSVPDEQQLLDFFTNSRNIFQQASFNLRSWSSNSKSLQARFEKDGVEDKDQEIKTLGMRWNPGSDILYIAQRPLPIQVDHSLTKREILKESSVIFDPLGLLSPVTVRSKMFMQSLWQHKLEWDEHLPDVIIKEWCKIKEDITKVTDTKFPRCYFPETVSFHKVLHVFTDSSMKAYGACAYLVSGAQSSLLMAKNKVAPLKQLTIPKLELCAAVLGARLCNHIVTSIECHRVYLWSDSQITLQWISASKKQNVFVSNRVREIQELTKTYQWRYCPTDSNPADLLSRGLSYDKFHDNRLWFNGPDWLKDESSFPVSSRSSNMPQTHEEYSDTTGPTTVLLNKITFIPGILYVIDLQRFSSYRKVLRVCAYILRFVDQCKKKRKAKGDLTPTELDTVAQSLIQHAQYTKYPEILEYLKTTKPRSSKPALVRQLDLYLDKSQIIRCGGRISNAPLPEQTKFPYLLPSSGRLTELIITDAHMTQLHSGVESTVTYLRQRFWVPSIRQRVRATIRTCVTCRKVTGSAYRVPDPPPLPSDRLKEAPPFTVTGIDFTGALTVKSARGYLQKVYVCLFTCASTRAIHLEVVPNMTTDAFILALRRFMSRKSTPKVIMSDNALTYIATAKILKEEVLNQHNITWKFIPQHAPWYGGWWERLIGITKTCLKKVLGKSLISLETLQTIITEAECIINDRPLTYLSHDPLDEEPLTPSHLLYGRRVTSPTYPDDRDESEAQADDISHSTANKLFRFKCATIEKFWSRWKHEYVTSLREFHKRSGGQGDQVRVGDVVQIQDDTLSRNRWSLGVIDDVIIGGDGRTRAARVKSRRGVTTRPIAKLYPLELRD